MDNKEFSKTEGKSGKAQLVGTFILGLIVGILVAPTFFGNSGTVDDEIKENDNEIKTEDVSLINESEEITVFNQLAGDRVLIKEVTLTSSGWAVVHEDIDGVPGNALGAQRFNMGTSLDVHVDLLRNTESNKLYYVILYKDNGDGEFDIKTDKPFVRGETSILATFETVTIDRKNN